MKNGWSFIWTLEFLVGTIIAGLLLNLVAVYVVRAVDHVSQALPRFYRRARNEESLRIEQLTAAGTSDNALYGALAAEAARLRVHQLLGFFIAFVCYSTLVLLATLIQATAAVQMTTTVRLQTAFLLIFLVTMGFLHYASGLEKGRRARRLDIALRAVQINRTLPIMD